MSNSRFDAEGFYAALDTERLARRLTWKQVAAESGVAASTLTRMGQGKRPDVDGLAALAAWAGIDAAHFYRPLDERRKKAEPLTEITALLRADNNLSGESARALESMLKSAYETLRKKRDEDKA